MVFSIAILAYELPYELSNDLRLKMLGNQETLLNCLNCLNFRGHLAECPASHAEIKLSLQLSKKEKNLIPNCSCPAQFYWISLFCSQYFAQDYLSKKIFGLKLARSFLNFYFLIFCMLSKHLSIPDGKYKAGQSC